MGAVDIAWQAGAAPSIKCDTVHSQQAQSREDVITSLLDKELWRSFHCKTNEMIVTKNGRCVSRVFIPVCCLFRHGLDPDR